MSRPKISEDELMIETDFYKWLKERHENGMEDNYFVLVLKEYMGKDNLKMEDEEDLLNHKYVFLFFKQTFRKSS